MVKGYSGKYGTQNRFEFKIVPESTVQQAREAVDLSRQIITIQSNYLKPFQQSQDKR